MPRIESSLLCVALVAAAVTSGIGNGAVPQLPGADAWDVQATVAYPEGGPLVGGRFRSAFALPLADGHWLVAGDRLVRFDPAGEVVSVSAFDPGELTNAGAKSGAALMPGGEVLSWSGADDCAIALVAGDGSQRWRHGSTGAGTCGAVLLHAGRLHQVVGVGQTAAIDLLSLDRRSQTLWRTRFSGEHASRAQVRLAAAEGGGLLAASVLRDGAGTTPARAVAALFDRAGVERGRWQGPPVVGLSLLALAPATGGGHWLVYADGSGGLLKVHLDANLHLVSSRQIAAPAGQRIGSVLIDGAGEGYALQDIGNSGLVQWLHRLGADALGWQRQGAVACPTLSSARCQVLAGNGDLVLIGPRQIERIDREGARRAVRHVQVPTTGSISWLGESAAGVAAIGVSGVESGAGVYRVVGRIEWLDPSANLVAGAEPPGFPKPQVGPAAAAVGSGGETVIALGWPGPRTGHLESIEPEGGRRWLRPLPAHYASSVLTSGSGEHCVLHSAHTSCWDADSGTMAWLHEQEASLFRRGRMWSDGSLVTVDSRTVFGGGVGFIVRQVVSRYAPGGDLRWRQTLPIVPYIGQSVIGVSERGTVAYRDPRGMLAYLDDTGAVLPTLVELPVVALGTGVEDSGLVDDAGRIAFVSERRVGTGMSVSVVGADPGGLAWELPLGGYAGSSLGGTRLIALAGGDMLVETTGLLRMPQREPTLGLMRIDAVGRALWQRTWSARTTAQHRVATDGAGRIVRAVQTRGAAHLLLETIDAATGISLSILRLPCPATGCGVRNVRLLPDGRLHMVSDGGGDSALPHLVARLDRLPQAALAPARLGLATGSFWQASDLAGSALTLSSPTPQRLVGAWATHSRRTDNSPAELRWYALEAQLLPGSNEAAVVISERPSGRFASGPGGPARQVGSGRLRFRGCDAGLLQYRFDEGYNDGVEGSLPLTRLLPPAEDCREPDGRLRPAVASYDPDLGGHWYDPAAPGQGLELARAAPGAGQAGLLFGLWFTFAPATGATAPGPVRWFTLQGQGVDGGVVRSTVLASIGGRFDDVAATNTFPVGAVELITEGCDRLRLRYRFDDDEVAGDFRALAGEIQLRRLGACPGA
jgi:hypothetical protein